MKEIVNNVVKYAVEHPEQSVTILIGLSGALIHWMKTGKLPLGRLPLRALRKQWKEISTQYFKTDRPTNVPGLVVAATEEELDRKLRNVYFESGDMYSFQYDGEILNFRRPEGYFDVDVEDPVASELHLRVFRLGDDRLLILAHHEASRYEEWSEHISGTGLSWKRGRALTTKVFNGLKLDYETVESEDSANLQVVS